MTLANVGATSAPGWTVLRDLLHQPCVAIGVGKGGKRAIGLTLGVETRRLAIGAEVERLAHVDAPALQVVERRRQVLYDEIEAPCTEPTGPWGMPLPMMIEHADPGGVSCTTR